MIPMRRKNYHDISIPVLNYNDSGLNSEEELPSYRSFRSLSNSDSDAQIFLTPRSSTESSVSFVGKKEEARNFNDDGHNTEVITGVSLLSQNVSVLEVEELPVLEELPMQQERECQIQVKVQRIIPRPSELSSFHTPTSIESIRLPALRPSPSFSLMSSSSTASTVTDDSISGASRRPTPLFKCPDHLSLPDLK